MAKLVLDLDRKDVSVDDFTDAFRTQIRLVREVMIAMEIPSHEVRWVIDDLRAGSAYAAASPQILGANAYMADIEAAMESAGAGINLLALSAERPRHFNDEALKLSRRLTELALQSNAGKARLVFGTTIVSPSTAVSANVAVITRGELPSIGSIEGQLIGIEGTDGAYKIAVRDPLRNRKVPCVISGELLPKVLTHYEQRVIVRGVIWSKDDGTPSRIEVRSLDPIPPDLELPSRDDVRGILRDFRLADGE